MVCFEFVLFWLDIYDEKGQKCLIFGNPTPLLLGEGCKNVFLYMTQVIKEI